MVRDNYWTRSDLILLIYAGILHVDYESLIPYMSESIKQNYNDIQNVTSEVEHVKLTLDALYEQSIDEDEQKPKQEISVTKRRRNRALAWIFSAVTVSVIIAVAVGFVFFTDQATQPQVPNQMKNPTPAAQVSGASEFERKILTEFYLSLHPNPLYKDHVWNLTEHHCTWKSIECNPSTGRVTKIAMVYFAKTAANVTIPEGFGNFTELQRLVLPFNHLVSTIPESFKNLKNLVELNLEHNNLVGTVPDLSGLTKLELVLLQQNKLTGSLSTLMQLPVLKKLAMDRNPLNTELPANISKSLSIIYLDQCHLYGTIPASWTSSNLTLIDLSNNKLNGSVPCLGPNVSTLKLAHNELDGEFCGGSLSSIEELDISDNKLIGDFELPAAKVPRMPKLALSQNQFTSFLRSLPNDTAPPSQCSANFNAFKCPVPSWTEKSCGASCS